MCDSVVCKYGTITWDRAGQIINVNKKENWAENSPLWNTRLRALGCWQTSIYPNKECTHHIFGEIVTQNAVRVRKSGAVGVQDEALAMAQIPFLSLVFTTRWSTLSLPITAAQKQTNKRTFNARMYARCLLFQRFSLGATVASSNPPVRSLLSSSSFRIRVSRSAFFLGSASNRRQSHVKRTVWMGYREICGLSLVGISPAWPRWRQYWWTRAEAGEVFWACSKPVQALLLSLFDILAHAWPPVSLAKKKKIEGGATGREGLSFSWYFAILACQMFVRFAARQAICRCANVVQYKSVVVDLVLVKKIVVVDDLGLLGVEFWTWIW